MADWKCETFRHHAHDRMRLASDAELTANDGRIPREARPPHVITDYHHCRRARLLVGVDENAPTQRRHARGSKSRRGHLGERDRFTLSRFGNEVPADRPKCADVCERSELAPPDEEVVQQPLLFAARQWIEFGERDEAIALVQWNVGIRVRVHDRIAGGAECHGDGDAKSADQREAGRLGEDPRAELDVEDGWRCVAVGEGAQCACETIEGESHDEGECHGPVPGHSDAGAPIDTTLQIELVQVAIDVVAHVTGKQGAEKRSRDARRSAGRRCAHRVLNDAGSSPRHIRSAALRASRSARAPAASSFTYRRALPPRSAMGSPIHDETNPFSSSRRIVMYTAARATLRPVRRSISSTIEMA
jgi:hypothetical protein